MASFKHTIITKKGHALMAKAVVSKQPIQFVNIKTSNHVFENSTNLETVETLESIKQVIGISEVKVQNDTTVEVSGVLSNKDLAEGYYCSAVALYAKDGDTDIIYSITTADQADWVPADNGTSATSVLFKLVTAVSNAANVSLNVDPLMFATVYQIDSLKNRIKNGEDTVNNIISGTTPVGDALKVAELGWGEQKVSTEVDLNNYLTAGSYITPNGGLNNLPTDAMQARYNILVIGGASYAVQIVAPPAKYNNKIWYRKYAAPNWGVWSEITATERGSNANGEYVKYPDGTLICYGTAVLASNDNAGTSIVLPMAFINTEYIVSASGRGILSGGAGGAYVTEAAIPNESTFIAKVLTHAASSITAPSNIRVMFLAIGRWK